MEKEKQLIPQLRFPEFEGEWEKVIISEIADKITDGTHDTPKPIKEGIPFLTAIHVKDGNIAFDNCYYLSEEEHNKIYKRCNPEFGDLLMVNIGAGTATSAMVNVNHEFSLKNVALIKPNKTKIYPKFFAQIQRKNSDRLRHQISSGGAQPFLSLKAIGKLKLNIPQLPEQQKIASFLTAIDAKITKLTKKKALLAQYKKGVMQKIFKQEIRFKDDEGNVFSDWQEKKLGDIGEIITGKTPSTSDKELWGGDIQFVTPTDIDEEKKYQKHTKRTVRKNDKLKVLPKHSIMYTCIASIGKMALSVNPCITNQQINSLVPNKEFKNEYVYYVLLQITPKIKSIQANTTLPIINKTEFSKFKIPVPCIAEQTKIANFLSELDVKIEALNTKIENSKNFKKGLLQQMFV